MLRFLYEVLIDGMKHGRLGVGSLYLYCICWKSLSVLYLLEVSICIVSVGSLYLYCICWKSLSVLYLCMFLYAR